MNGLIRFLILALGLGAKLAAAQTPTREMAYTSRVSIVTTDPKGKVTAQPPVVARTVVRGDSARADVTEGMGDFKPGAFFLTYDGGHPIYIVYPEKRQYSVVQLDSMGDALAGALNHGVLKVKLDSVQARFERVATHDSIGGFRTARARITRSYRVTAQVTMVELERMAVTLGKRTVFVETSVIDWIEARDNYACLHVGQQQHLVRETLATLEASLDPKLWVRIHRSAIVRFDRIKELRNLGLGDRAVILQDGTELPVGQKYRDRLPQG